MNNKVSQIINNAIAQKKDTQIHAVKQCLDLTFPYISKSYSNSRKCIQHTITELGRLPISIIVLLQLAITKLKELSEKYEHVPSKSLNYINNVPDIDFKEISRCRNSQAFE